MGSHDDCVMALALANKATQSISIPFALSSVGSQSTRSQDPLFSGFGVNTSLESDIVRMIRMGIIK
jgi:hypothetical protein